MTTPTEIRRAALLSAQGMVAMLRNTTVLQADLDRSMEASLREALATLDLARKLVSGVQERLLSNLETSPVRIGEFQAELDWINNELGKLVAIQ